MRQQYRVTSDVAASPSTQTSRRNLIAGGAAALFAGAAASVVDAGPADPLPSRTEIVQLSKIVQGQEVPTADRSFQCPDGHRTRQTKYRIQANVVPTECDEDCSAELLNGVLEALVTVTRRENPELQLSGRGCFEGLVQDWMRWYPSFVPNREWLARQSLIGLLDDELREVMGVEPPPAFVQRQVNLVAKAYLKSTPYRVFRKDRNLINFFGKDSPTPRDLETVGHVPMRERAEAPRS